MAHTDQDEVVAQAIFDLIDANKVTLGLDLTLWGNQLQIPKANTAVVMAQGKRRALAGVSAPGGRTENKLYVTIEILRSVVGDEATERKAVDAIATAVEILIHQNTTLGGIIIHGFIDQVDRGVAERIVGSSSSMFRAVRMNFVGTTKTYLST